MSSTAPTQELNILGKVASVVGLLGAALFFTGWIYRWSYFYFFQLEVTTLDLPAQSFLIVPLQVFFGDGWAIFKSVIALIFTAIAIIITLWLIQVIGSAVSVKIDRWRSHIISYCERRDRFWWARQLKSLVQFNSINIDSIKFLRSLVDEVVIVAWILVVLFWLASWQGTADARRDAGQNSTLPVVTLVTPENRSALGRTLDDEFTNPSLKGYRIIGDRGLFNSVRRKGETDTSNKNNPRVVWRLLMERGGWIYLFTALPVNSQASDRPIVIAIQEGQLSQHLMILSGETSKTK